MRFLLILIFFLKLSAIEKEDFLIDVCVLQTDSGDVIIELFKNDAPKHCENFIKLIKNRSYEGLAFHRVIPGFMIQTGDPNTKGEKSKDWGSGNKGEEIESEISRIHFRGAVAMARTADEVNPEKKSSGSQFYICVRPQHQLDGEYTVFGRVVLGLEVVDKINYTKTDSTDKPIDTIRITKTYIDKLFDEKQYNWALKKRF
ncbi:MAG: peptidylprolyl isomerase [Candidatus Delongbacteria bacterium]|nr:peptidylprolyl isomerase [Candidatus Delongbacteria bacterium]MBN2835832.1 peptidylprolyl isomerase [Candidatus Delongbacteria bacterium]